MFLSCKKCTFLAPKYFDMWHTFFGHRCLFWFYLIKHKIGASRAQCNMTRYMMRHIGLQFQLFAILPIFGFNNKTNLGWHHKTFSDANYIASLLGWYGERVVRFKTLDKNRHTWCLIHNFIHLTCDLQDKNENMNIFENIAPYIVRYSMFK